MDLCPQSRGKKAKLNKLNYIKLKSFCKVRETINKMKRQPKNANRKLYKKVVELAQDKGSYFGNLVQDYKVYSLEMLQFMGSQRVGHD